MATVPGVGNVGNDLTTRTPGGRSHRDEPGIGEIRDPGRDSATVKV